MTPRTRPASPALSRRGRVLLSLLLGGLLTATPALAQATAPAQPQTQPVSAPSPAQAVFDRVNQLLRSEYGGLSTVDRAALNREYQERLDAVCAPAPQTCAEDKAYPVIQAQMTALGDEHSFFQTPDDYDEFLTAVRGGDRLQFGVKLATLDGEARVVTEVLPGSASERAGLRRGDVLVSLNGSPYTYARLREARENGETITLGVTRLGQPLTLPITPVASTTRDLPRLSFVTGAAQTGATATATAPVAVLRIPTFLAGGGVAQRVHDLVAEAQSAGARGLIVDLRGNGGGSLAECDNAVSAFLPSLARLARGASGVGRTVVSRGARLEDGQPAGSVRRPRLWTGPLSVLVDSGSASCSEFFAFEIQYAGRGPVIGEVTAGVGNTATRVFEAGKGALQLTTLNYVKPDGTPYPLNVRPDVAREQGEEQVRQLTLGRDELLLTAVESLAGAPTLSVDALRGRP